MDIPEETVADLTRRLRKVEGQVRGVQQMLADSRDCGDVVAQIAAARKALDHAGFLLVANRIAWCATHPDEATRDGEGLADLQRLFMKLA